MQPIQVVITNVHASIAEAVHLALEQAQGLRVVGQACTIQALLSLLGQHPSNVLLLDSAVATGNGFDVISTLWNQYPQSRVLLFTDSYTEAMVFQALGAGAWGCMSKDEELETVLKAIRAVSEGEIWAPRWLLSQVLMQAKAWGLTQENSTQLLTDREREVCYHVAQGETNKEIAAKLCITEKTVKSHLNRIFHKLQVRRRVDLAVLQAADRALPRLVAGHATENSRHPIRSL